MFCPLKILPNRFSKGIKVELTPTKKVLFTLNEGANLAEVREALIADAEIGRLGGFIPVVNDAGCVLGTITDSDLRKQVSVMGNEDSTAGKICNREFIHAKSDLSPSGIAESVLTQLKRRRIANSFPITYLPLIKEDKTISKIIHISDILPAIEDLNRQVIVLGQGFVGLTLSMALVDSGMKVFALEKNTETITAIQMLKPQVFEPQLTEILTSNLGLNYSISESELPDRAPIFCRRAYIIAVGTPHKADQTDLSQIEDAVIKISKSLEYGDLVLLRSTVPVGTTKKLVGEAIFKRCGLIPGIDFNLAYTPERTVEGNAIAETRRLPQLIAGYTEECAQAAMKFFSGFVSTVVLMESLEACELAKLSSNAYRDVIFGFANEIAISASRFGIDVNRMISDANVGYARNAIPQPSPGVGGPCLTKDSYMITGNPESSVILSARAVNELMPELVANQLKSLLSDQSDEILIVGLCFKGTPPTNDLRNSPAIEIHNKLKEFGFQLAGADSSASHKSLLENGIKPLNSYETGSFNPKLIAILNNHASNLEMVREILKFLPENVDRILYDPWNLATEFDFPGIFSKTFRLATTSLRIE